jgi:predicted lactoylglutathione lyase
MTSMIFVNLPVLKLPRAKEFYSAIGFTNNPQFTDETAACMVLSESIQFMLLTHEKWQGFTLKKIPDGHIWEPMWMDMSAMPGERTVVSR